MLIETWSLIRWYIDSYSYHSRLNHTYFIIESSVQYTTENKYFIYRYNKIKKHIYIFCKNKNVCEA